MVALLLNVFVLALLRDGVAAIPSAGRGSRSSNFNLEPFNINLSHEVPHMIDQIKRTQVPKNGGYLDPKAGIALDTLLSLRHEWVADFSWEREQQKLNKLNHFTAEIENLTIHFVYEKSRCSNAIPIILNHGWPGSFLEFVPLIELLKEDFDVIIPSLPGFAFSSPPPAKWTAADTARVFNTLMTKVLGYPKYATYGTDWGGSVAYNLYANFNTSVRAGHFSFIPFFPLNSTQLTAQNISFSSLESFELQRFEDWSTIGNGYFLEQTTEPNSIGFALYDSPIGHLSYMGGKFLDWSDPRAGQSPSVLNHNEILKSISLYYLTKSITSSIYMYYLNPQGFSPTYTKAETDAPLLFSAFKYNVGFWPPELVARVGNLVSYNNHEFGGHFPGLDNPTALAEDLKKIKTFWT